MDDTKASMKRLQKECLDSMDSSLQMTYETVQVSEFTAKKLQEQTERIKQVKSTSEKLTENLAASEYLLYGMKSWWNGLTQYLSSSSAPPKATNNTLLPASKEKQKTSNSSSGKEVSSRSVWPSEDIGVNGKRWAADSTVGCVGGSVIDDEHTNLVDPIIDGKLDILSGMVGELQNRALLMNANISEQTSLLTSLNNEVQDSQAKVAKQRKAMDALLRS